MSKYELKKYLLKEEVNPAKNELILYHLTGLDKFRKYSEDVVNYMKNYKKSLPHIQSRRQHIDAGEEDLFNKKFISKYIKLTGDRKKDVLEKIKLFNTLKQYDLQGKELDDKLMLMGLEALLANPYTKGTGFSAGDGDSYGPALYTCYDFNPEIAKFYGTTCLKFKTSFDGILIFLEDLAKEVYGKNWRLENQIVIIFEYMFGPNLDEYLIELKAKLIEFLKPLTHEIVGKNRFDHTRHSHIKHAGITAGPAKDFADFLKRDISDSSRTNSFLGAPKGAQIYEYILKGMMFNGGTDGPVCLLYNPKKDVQITQIGKVNNEDVDFFDSMNDYFEGKAGIDIPFEQLNAIGEDLEETEENRHQKNYDDLLNKKEEYPSEFKFIPNDLLYSKKDIRDVIITVIQKVDDAIKEDSSIKHDDIISLIEILLSEAAPIDLFTVDVLETLFNFSSDITPYLDFMHSEPEALIQINNITDCLIKIASQSSDFINKIPEIFENLFFKRASIYKNLSFYYVYEFVNKANQGQVPSDIAKNIIADLVKSSSEEICNLFKDHYRLSNEDYDKMFEIIKFISSESNACHRLFDEFMSAIEIIANQKMLDTLKEKDFLSDDVIRNALSSEQIKYYEDLLGLNFRFEDLISKNNFNDFFSMYENALNSGFLLDIHIEKLSTSILSDSLDFSLSSLSSNEIESLITICTKSIKRVIENESDFLKITNRIKHLISFINYEFKSGSLDSSSLVFVRTVLDIYRVLQSKASNSPDLYNVFINMMSYLKELDCTNVIHRLVRRTPYMLVDILSSGEKEIFEKVINIFNKNDYLAYFQNATGTTLTKHIDFIKYVLEFHQDKINEKTKKLFDVIVEQDNILNKLNSSNESLYLLKSLIKESLKLYNE